MNVNNRKYKTFFKGAFRLQKKQKLSFVLFMGEIGKIVSFDQTIRQRQNVIVMKNNGLLTK